MFSKVAAVALVGFAALSGVARAQDDPPPPGDDGPGGPPQDCQTAAEVIAEVAGPNAAQLLGRVTALEAAALLEQAAGASELAEDEVTLFIPTDKAFGDAGANDLTDEQLLQVFAVHAVSGAVSTQQLQAEEEFMSLIGGTDLMGVDQGENGGVMVVGSSEDPSLVVDPDIPACSGPVHIIDKVLLPQSLAAGAPAPAPMAEGPAPVPADMAIDPVTGLPVDGPAAGPGEEMPCDTILDALMMKPETNGLALVADAVLDEETKMVLANETQELTLFAPPQTDVLQLLGGFQNGLVDMETVATIVKAHVVLQKLTAEDVAGADGEMFPTANGINDTLEVMVDGEDISIVANNTVMVNDTDLEACSENAALHTVDGLIIPMGLMQEVMLEEYPQGDFAQLVMAQEPSMAPALAPTTGDALAPADGGTRDVGGAQGPEAAGSNAHGVFRGLLTIGAAVVAFAAAL